jgi:hypothetical protein
MELDLQMPKHECRIQRKRNIQGSAKTSLEVRIDSVTRDAITSPWNAGSPDLVHWVAFSPKHRYIDAADEEVESRTEVQDTFAVILRPLQL